MSKLILKISSLIVVIILALIYLNFFSNIVFSWKKKMLSKQLKIGEG